MKRIRPYRTYRFQGKDPIIYKIRNVVEGSGDTFTSIAESSGVSANTLYNWFSGGTRRPQFASLNAVARACGHELSLTKKH